MRVRTFERIGRYEHLDGALLDLFQPPGAEHVVRQRGIDMPRPLVLEPEGDVHKRAAGDGKSSTTRQFLPSTSPMISSTLAFSSWP